MSHSRCRWGILGTAGIARKNWQALRESGNAVLTAVGSRNSQRAAQFIAECQSCVPWPELPRPVAYDELLNSPDVDAVYIPLPTGLRKEWVIRAARAGKHVVCEKPCGVSAADVAEMLDACREQGVQFMDGVMFLHSQRLEQIRQVLLDGATIGPVRRIATQFSFHGDAAFLSGNIRANSRLEPLGCLGDLGWYNIRFTLWAMHYQRPVRVTGRVLTATSAESGEVSVPLEFAGELYFPGPVSASFYCSFLTELQQWADVSGARGRLHVKDFVLPYYGSEVAFQVWQDVFAVQGCQFNMEQHVRRVAAREYSNNAASAQESCLFRQFSALVLSGRVDPTWGEQALLTQQVLDACLESSRRDGQPVALDARAP